jgi:hypothetical protein
LSRADVAAAAKEAHLELAVAGVDVDVQADRP